MCDIPGVNETVIYDSLGGMIPRTGNQPLLTIQTDGHAILGDPYGTGRRIEQQLSPIQIQQLLDFIIGQNGFFDIDAPAIQLQIRKQQNTNGRIFSIADAGESIIRVCSGKNQKEVKFYALSHAAKQFPEIQVLQQLHAIEQELKRTASWIRMGGDKGANAILAAANEHLMRNHPDIELLTLENLSTAVTGADGKLTVYFSRRGFAEQGPHMRNISVIAYYPSGQNNKATIMVNLE